MRPCLIAVKFYGFIRFLPTPNGGDEEDRTPDPLRARQVLSQLSYTPIFLEGTDFIRALKIKQRT